MFSDFYGVLSWRKVACAVIDYILVITAARHGIRLLKHATVDSTELGPRPGRTDTKFYLKDSKSGVYFTPDVHGISVTTNCGMVTCLGLLTYLPLRNDGLVQLKEDKDILKRERKVLLESHRISRVSLTGCATLKESQMAHSKSFWFIQLHISARVCRFRPRCVWSSYDYLHRKKTSC